MRAMVSEDSCSRKEMILELYIKREIKMCWAEKRKEEKLAYHEKGAPCSYSEGIYEEQSGVCKGI